jgi:hypothetical protein
MTHVGRWFSSLSADERKSVLYALHCFRNLGETMPPHRAIEHAKSMWPHVEDLLLALEKDHEDFKNEESRPTIPSPGVSGEFSVLPGPCDAKLK